MLYNQHINVRQYIVPEPNPLEEPRPKKPRSAWEILDSDSDDEDGGGQQRKETAQEELRRFVISDSLHRDEDPLLWWRQHEDNFPRLSKVARDVLGTPATSTPAERMFSPGGLVASQQRASIKPQNLDAIVFLSRNMPTLFNMKPLGQEGSTGTTGPMVKAEPVELDVPLGPSTSAAQATAEINENPELPILSAIEASWEDS